MTISPWISDDAPIWFYFLERFGEKKPEGAWCSVHSCPLRRCTPEMHGFDDPAPGWTRWQDSDGVWRYAPTD